MPSSSSRLARALATLVVVVGGATEAGCADEGGGARGSGSGAGSGTGGSGATGAGDTGAGGGSGGSGTGGSAAGGSAAGGSGTGGSTAGGGGTGGQGGGGGAVDPLAPGEVTGLVALPSAGSVYVGWTPPPDPTYAGVVVLGRAGGAVTDAPATGAAYAPGDSVGASHVVFAADGNHVLDAPLPNDITVHYRAFTYATGFHYSQGITESATPHLVVPQAFTDVTIAAGFQSTIRSVDLALGAGGALHVLVTAGASNQSWHVHYGTCSSSCGSAASWTFLELGTVPEYRRGRLALDPQDHPRVVYPPDYGPTARYRACTAGCDLEPNWSTVDLAAGSGSAIGVDATGRAWIVSAGTPLNVSTCAAGCSSVANWVTFSPAPDGSFVEDLQLPSSGAASLLYYHYNGASFELHHASCGADCTDVASWTDTYVTTTQGSAPAASYRFMPDGKGARMIERQWNADNQYYACDGCAPGEPSFVYQFDNTQAYNMMKLEISSKGQPRLLTDLSTGAVHVTACAYECDLPARWTATAVTPSGASAADLQLDAADRTVVAYGLGTNLVVRMP